MAFVIMKRSGHKLDSWHPNANCLGRLKETISFSNKSYTIFSNKQEAQGYIDMMKKGLSDMDKFNLPEQEKNIQKIENLLPSLMIIDI